MGPYEDFFAGKRITLMGLGLLGRGLGDARFLVPLCKELVVTDLKTEEQLADSLEQLKEFSNVIYHLGGHQEKDFTGTDMVIKAAGVPLNSPYIAAARAAGVPVYMSTALFAQFVREIGATVVGVTGTRGKSTVAAMIFGILKATGKRVWLGGNVRGVSTLALLPEVKSGDIVVLELDSWQLQGFGDIKISPDIAVFTNFMPDHLNYYHGDMEQYFWDKANIFIYQKIGDKLVAGASVLSKIQNANPPVVPLVAPPVPEGWRLRVLGEHNKENATFAVLALRMLGLGDEEIKRGLESFAPVEGRLQFVREINGVKIYNDNNATTPEATLAALSSFEPDKTILITGGADKNLELNLLGAQIQKCKKVLLLDGTGTQRLEQFVPQAMTYADIISALEAAFALAVSGDVILFSPAFASFGMFKNEYDRGDQFIAAVKAL